ncbi:MAG TPA: hypothetical protein VII66_01085 [Gemmatimonadaceae bacterium]
MLSLEHLTPAFTLLTDRTGRAIGPETMRLYAENFAAMHVSIEAVYEAVRDIVRTWEKPYWPTAEYIGNVAQRKQADAMPGHDRAMVLHGQSVDQGARDWEDRRHRAEEWFEANPATGRLLIAGIDADIAEQSAKQPRGRLAGSPEYRKALRHGAIVGACLHHLACGQTIGARIELKNLGERFPELAVDLYAAHRVTEPAS